MHRLVCTGRSAALSLLLLAGAPARAGEVLVQLLDPGVEPRQQLLIRPKEGSVEQIHMTTDVTTTIELPGMGAQTVLAPSSNVVMEIKVVDVEDDGDIRYTFRIQDVSVTDREGAMPGMSDSMLLALRPLVGTLGEVLVDPTGRPKDSSLTPSTTADPAMVDNMSRSMKNASAPLPLEAVGVGARWSLTQELDEQGIRVQQVATYELTGRKKDEITLRTTITQSAPAQSMTPPGLPPGTSATLSRMESKGEGSSTLRLDAIMPTEAAVSLALEMDMRISAEGQEMPMSTRLQMDNRIQRR